MCTCYTIVSHTHILMHKCAHTHTPQTDTHHSHTHTPHHKQYQSRALVIRYNHAVLEPSGDFQIDDGEEVSGAGFPWWGILIIVAGALVLVAAVSVVVMVSLSLWITLGNDASLVTRPLSRFQCYVHADRKRGSGLRTRLARQSYTPCT